MLEQLHVRHYGLIDDVLLTCSPSFNVLTGETGAGKSILVGALGLLLGRQASQKEIQTGHTEAVVTGVLRVKEESEAASWLLERGFSPEEGRFHIRRILRRQGRGSSFIQSTPVTRADLETLSLLLFDMHSQHDHQTLFYTDNHRKLLDRYAGIEKEVHHFSENFNTLLSLQKRKKNLEENEARLKGEQEYAQFAIAEIEKIAPREGEEEELLERLKKLACREELIASLATFSQRVEGEQGILDSWKEAKLAVEKIVAIDPALRSLQERCEGLFYELEDIIDTLGRYGGEQEHDEEEMTQCEDRLEELSRLRRKHEGRPLVEILAYARDNKKKWENTNYKEEALRLDQGIAAKEKALLIQAKRFSTERRKAAQRLQGIVSDILEDMGLPAARFQVHFSNQKTSLRGVSCRGHGLDTIEFLFSANTGEPVRPLSEVASGGEIARVMLALKSGLARADNVETLVFDEIDVGVGGRVAVKVGEYMMRLAKHKQIFSVTHLAPIAALADNHICVDKKEDAERALTVAFSVAKERRVEEIARMLSGNSDKAVSLEHARDLLRDCC